MSGWLVRTRVEREIDHEQALIRWRADVPATISVRDVRVEEACGDILEERDAVRSDADARHMATILGEDVVGRATRNAVSNGNLSVRHFAELVPVAHVRISDSNLVARAHEHRIGSDIGSGADTDIDGLNGPLKCLQQDVIAGLVDVGDLVAMDTDEREADALDEDLVNIGMDEDVIDIEIEVSESGSRYNWCAERGCRCGVDDGAKELRRTGELDANESLTVRDADRWDGEARVRVEPEEEWDHEFEVVVSRLVRLVAVIVLERGARIVWPNSRRRVGVVAVHGINREFLTHVAEPANFLTLADAELTVHVVDIRGVLIERIAVDIEADLLEETFAWEVAPAVHGTINQRVSRGACERDSRGGNLDVDNHITEEVAELRDRELNARAERGVGSNLVVLEAHRNERFVCGVHEDDVGHLDIC